jgi:hypothetical protein
LVELVTQDDWSGESGDILLAVGFSFSSKRGAISGSAIKNDGETCTNMGV